MGKCFDDFNELIDDMKEKHKYGEIDGKAMECALLGTWHIL